MPAAQSAAIAHTKTRQTIPHPFFFWNFISAGTSRIFLRKLYHLASRPLVKFYESLASVFSLRRYFLISLLLDCVLELIRMFSVRCNDNFHLSRQSRELSCPRIRYDLDGESLAAPQHRSAHPQRERHFVSCHRPIRNLRGDVQSLL